MRARSLIKGLATLGAAGALAAGTAVGTAAAAAPAPAYAPGTPCASTAKACVDLVHHRAWLISNGHAYFGPVPIMPGMPSAPTYPGTFAVQWKDIDHRSHEFNNAPMPYSVFFDGGIAFHEGSLSTPSNGCVHLSHVSAQVFYSHLNVGDQVIVAG